MDKIENPMGCGKGRYFKDERSLGGRGGRPNAVNISDSAVMTSFCVQRGEGVKKGRKNTNRTYIGSH